MHISRSPKCLHLQVLLSLNLHTYISFNSSPQCCILRGFVNWGFSTVEIGVYGHVVTCCWLNIDDEPVENIHIDIYQRIIFSWTMFG